MTPGTKTRALWLPSADTFWTFTSGPRPTTRNPPPATFATASWPDSVSFRSGLVWPSLLTLLVARVANRPVVHSSQFAVTHSLTHSHTVILTHSKSPLLTATHHSPTHSLPLPLTQLAQRSAAHTAAAGSVGTQPVVTTSLSPSPVCVLVIASEESSGHVLASLRVAPNAANNVDTHMRCRSRLGSRIVIVRHMSTIKESFIATKITQESSTKRTAGTRTLLCCGTL